MSDDGLLPDLRYARTEIASLGVPNHDAVGNHEITQGANAEDGHFRQVVRDTLRLYRRARERHRHRQRARGGEQPVLRPLVATASELFA